MIQRLTQLIYQLHPIIRPLLLVLVLATTTLAQTEIRLYDGPAPGSEAQTRPESTQPDRSFNRVVYNVSTPTLTAYLPDPAKATGRAVLIFPGGGLSRLLIDEQGAFVAQQLAERGVAAFVVKYRLATGRQ